MTEPWGHHADDLSNHVISAAVWFSQQHKDSQLDGFIVMYYL